MIKIGFIGAGKVGTALAVQLSAKGYPVVAVASRTMQSAQKLADAVATCRAYENVQQISDNTDLIFITTPDDAIEPVAAKIKWHKGNLVVHCSGGNGLQLLRYADEAVHRHLAGIWSGLKRCHRGAFAIATGNRQ